MKRYCCLFLILACMGPSLIAQDSTGLKKISFRIMVTGFDGKASKGWLSKINDSVIAVSPIPRHLFDTILVAGNSLREFNYSLVSEIKLKRKNGAGRGALIGAACGLLAGVAAGFIEGDDPHVPASQDFLGIGEAFRMTAGEKAIVYGFSGGVVAGGIGALIGALAKRTFVIAGKKKNFDDMRLSVLDKAYRH